MPKIPINVSDLPTEREDLDESLAYSVVVRACKLSEETDKNGNYYLTGVKMEIVEPVEWKGRSIYANYICIPEDPGPNASLAERRDMEEQGITLARFFKAFKVPCGSDGFEVQDVIGCMGEVSVVNEEYQGRKNPKVKDYLI